MDNQNRFTKFILKTPPPASPVLPLMHTTDGYSFRDILDKCMLEPKECTVFVSEELLYFFYGRPAYRTRSSDKPTSYNMFYPVCFLIDAESVGCATRVFPFDSGAFKAEVYDDYLHRKMEMDNFMADPVDPDPRAIVIPEIPAQIVSTFYGSNKQYYEGVAKDDVDIGPLDFEANIYYDLIKTKHKTLFDDRGVSVEIQFDEHLQLNKDTLSAVVLPTDFLDDSEIAKTVIDVWEAEPLTYGTYHADPSHFTTLVISEVEKYLKTEGLYV